MVIPCPEKVHLRPVEFDDFPISSMTPPKGHLLQSLEDLLGQRHVPARTLVIGGCCGDFKGFHHQKQGDYSDLTKQKGPALHPTSLQNLPNLYTYYIYKHLPTAVASKSIIYAEIVQVVNPANICDREADLQARLTTLKIPNPRFHRINHQVLGTLISK